MSASPDNSDTLLARLLDLHPKLIDLSLGRMQRLLAALDNPQDKCPPIIHVAGTNGKGSTLAFVRAMLEAAGHRVHAYSSPHLVAFHERITLASQQISEQQLAHYLARCEDANQGHDITFFEITTAAAFCAFAEHEADFLLLEVGLGGRLDATNLVDPLVTAITPVSLDHEDFLGSSIAGIAAEKAGIIQPNRPVIVAPQVPEAADIIEQTAQAQGAPIARAGQDWQVWEEHGRLVYQDENGLLDLPHPALIGRHQIINAGTAIAIARQLGLGAAEIGQGLETAQWPARLQKLTSGKLGAPLTDKGSELWLDGGHNQAAARMLADWLNSQQGRPLHMIIGLLTSKAQDNYLAELAQVDGLAGRLNLHFVPIASSDNATPPQELQQAAKRLGLDSQCHEHFEAALAAISDAHALILIAGSLYLAGDVLRVNQS